jgi:hypothetical protein
MLLLLFTVSNAGLISTTFTRTFSIVTNTHVQPLSKICTITGSNIQESCLWTREMTKKNSNIRSILVLYLQMMTEDIYQGIINKNRAVCQPKVMPFRINLFPAIRSITTFLLWSSLKDKHYPELYWNIYFYSAVHAGRDSSVGIAIRYELDGPKVEFRWEGEIFHTRPDGPWGPPSLLHNG